MGYQTVNLIMKDGVVVPDVVILDCAFISEVRGQSSVSIDPDQIADVQVSHKKWPWRA
jgi:hypothetical protein